MSSPKNERASRPSVHASIDVPDLEAGLEFYGTVFGFKEISRPFESMAILDANNMTICMHAKAANRLHAFASSSTSAPPSATRCASQQKSGSSGSP